MEVEDIRPGGIYRIDAEPKKQTVQSPETAAEIMRLHLGQVTDEHLVVILLDAQDHEIATVTVQEGTPDTCLCSVEKIMLAAIQHKARGVIMGHNHTRGKATPSPQDTAFFQRLKTAFSFLDHTDLLDCLIIGDQTNDLFSLARSAWTLQKRG